VVAMAEVALADAIAAVRGQLQLAQEAGAESDVRFTLGSVEVEFAVEVFTTGGGEASVKVLGLITAGAKAERSRGETHIVRVVLHPVNRDGTPFEVSADRGHRPDGHPGR
jgi:hypothetical protein